MAKIKAGPHKTKADLEANVDAKHHDLFIEVDGVGFVLDSDKGDGLRHEKDEAIAARRAAEERTKEAERKAAEADKAAEEARAALKKMQDDEEARGAGSTPEEIETLVQARLGEMQKDLETRLETMTTDRDEWKGKYEDLNVRHISSEVDRVVTAECAALNLPFVGARAQATLMSEARGVFTVNENGEIEGRDSAGNLLMSKDAKNPLQVKEWLEGQHAEPDQAYLFTGKSGGGAEDPAKRPIRASGGEGEETSRSKISAGVERLRAAG